MGDDSSNRAARNNFNFQSVTFTLRPLYFLTHACFVSYNPIQKSRMGIYLEFRPFPYEPTGEGRLKEKSHVWKIYQFLSVFSVFGRFSSDIRRMFGKLEGWPGVVNCGS